MHIPLILEENRSELAMSVGCRAFVDTGRYQPHATPAPLVDDWRDAPKKSATTDVTYSDPNARGLMGFSTHTLEPVMFDHASLPRRFVPTFSETLKQWVVFDAEDGHETPCDNRTVAIDYSAICEAARRLKLMKCRRLANLWEIA